MTEMSYPWRGRSPAFAGDAGAYSHDQWNDWMQSISQRGGGRRLFRNFDDMGVFVRSYINGETTTDVIDDWAALTAYNVGDVVKPTTDNYHYYRCNVAGTTGVVEPTWITYPGGTLSDGTVTWECVGPGGLAPFLDNTVNIPPGCALVDGTFYTNNSIEQFVIPATSGAGQVRIDRIVLRKTYGVGTQTVRLTHLSGSEVTSDCTTELASETNWPALTQDVDRLTYWDIPIAACCVDHTGTITLVDDREFVDASSKRFFADCVSGYDVTAGSDLYQESTGTASYVVLVAGNDAEGYGKFIVPEDYISGMLVTPVIIAPTGPEGTVSLWNYCRYGGCDEGYDTHADNVQDKPGAGSNVLNCVDDVATDMAYAVFGDIVHMELRRLGSSDPGTHAGDIYVVGWIVDYIGLV